MCFQEGYREEWSLSSPLLSSHTASLSASSETQFRISVYYRGVKVSEQLVENEAGIRLVYR